MPGREKMTPPTSSAAATAAGGFPPAGAEAPADSNRRIVGGDAEEVVSGHSPRGCTWKRFCLPPYGSQLC